MAKSDELLKVRARMTSYVLAQRKRLGLTDQHIVLLVYLIDQMDKDFEVNAGVHDIAKWWGAHDKTVDKYIMRLKVGRGPRLQLFRRPLDEEWQATKIFDLRPLAKMAGVIDA